MAIRSKLLSILRPVASLAFVGLFSVICFGQAVQTAAAVREISPFELIGWITLTGAGVAHIATNVYNLIRGKNYEELKEALANFKQLAESRLAVILELEARCKKLELEAENAVELAMRVGAMEKKK